MRQVGFSNTDTASTALGDHAFFICYENHMLELRKHATARPNQQQPQATKTNKDINAHVNIHSTDEKCRDANMNTNGNVNADLSTVSNTNASINANSTDRVQRTPKIRPTGRTRQR